MKKGSAAHRRVKKQIFTRANHKGRGRPSLGNSRGNNDLVHFRALSRNSLAGEYVFQEGRTLYVNPALARMFGYMRSGLVGQDLLILIHPDERPADIEFEHSEDWEEFKKPHQELASAVAEHVALALVNLQLRETLRAQSIRDPLTGLVNRRYREESLQHEVLRASRNKAPIGILLLDIHQFKQYNDTFGHEAVDAVLKGIGRRLHKQFRGDDNACRFGGEEFVLIMPGALPEVAQQLAQQVHEAVRHLTVNFHGQTLGAIYPLQGSDAESGLQSADKPLYRARESGRDQTVLATPVSEQD